MAEGRAGFFSKAHCPQHLRADYFGVVVWDDRGCPGFSALMCRWTGFLYHCSRVAGIAYAAREARRGRDSAVGRSTAVGSPAPGNVVNLMDALRQSIAAEKPAR